MSYVNSGVGDLFAFITEAVAKTAGASVEAGAGKYAKGARTARNVEQAARAELAAAQATAQGGQQASRVAAEGQVAAAQARIEAQRKAAEKQSKMLMIGAAGLAGVLVLGFVAYRITRSA